MFPLIALIVITAAITFFVPYHAYAAWVPLIQATDFDGIRTDVLATVAGIVSILLIILGIGLFIKTIGR